MSYGELVEAIIAGSARENEGIASHGCAARSGATAKRKSSNSVPEGLAKTLRGDAARAPTSSPPSASPAFCADGRAAAFALDLPAKAAFEAGEAVGKRRLPGRRLPDRRPQARWTASWSTRSSSMNCARRPLPPVRRRLPSRWSMSPPFAIACCRFGWVKDARVSRPPARYARGRHRRADPLSASGRTASNSR